MNATKAGDGQDSDGSHDPPIEIVSVGSRSEADLIVGLLRSSGLDAELETDDAGGAQPQWQLSGVRVLVAAADAEAARALLAEQAADQAGEG